MALVELAYRADVEHDEVPARRPAQEVVQCDDGGLLVVVLTEVDPPRRFGTRYPGLGESAYPVDDGGDVLTGERVVNAGAVLPAHHQAGSAQSLQMGRHRGQTEFRGRGELVDRPLALSEQVEQLEPTSVGQRLPHLGEVLVEGVLGVRIGHC